MRNLKMEMRKRRAVKMRKEVTRMWRVGDHGTNRMCCYNVKGGIFTNEDMFHMKEDGNQGPDSRSPLKFRCILSIVFYQ